MKTHLTPVQSIAGTLGAWIVLCILIMNKTSSIPGDEILTGCLFQIPKYSYAVWIPPVIFETIIIALTVYGVIRVNERTPTLTILARDSIIFFVIISVILLSNLFLARYGKEFIRSLLILPCSVVTCIAAARMTLNIRESITIARELQSRAIELETLSVHRSGHSTSDAHEEVLLITAV
ncbi:hypothetical protein H2248_005456 [Termitomyces sp. 'cryptogamus']|nr:hypothetical protein H2248_005456 [Termitomyces sp. 'cryptogamus']